MRASRRRQASSPDSSNRWGSTCDRRGRITRALAHLGDFTADEIPLDPKAAAARQHLGST